MVYTGGPEPYQFSAWEFGDIPSGKTRQNMILYDLGLNVGSFADTNGFANYKRMYILLSNSLLFQLLREF
jgi:hypothetical protein